VRELFNLTFPQLVQSTKMRRAANLLTGTDLPIGRIAPLVGYDDQNYFTTVFKKHLGRSPRAYRKHSALQA
jgi:two-component system response regulator YesN